MDANIVLSTSQQLQLTKYSTQELISILAKKDDLELSVYESDMTISKAMDGTSLKKLTAVIDKKNVTKILVFLTNRLSSNFNFGKTFTDEQSVMLAIDLIDIFQHETIEDVLLMFRYARTGRIGSAKEFKLDSQTVFHKWIPEYLEIKAEARERIHNRDKDKLTALPKWDLENVEKFKVSDKKETIQNEPNGLGKRTKLAYGTRTTPIVDRREYLKGLAYTATTVPLENVKGALQHFIEKNEPDAIEVIEKELQRRKNL